MSVVLILQKVNKTLQNAKKSVDKFAIRNYTLGKVCRTQTLKKGRSNMFRNLDAEQSRNSYTNSKTAEHLGISRVSYENKKKSGKFTTVEAKKLCKLFGCSFDYLFETDEERASSH